MYIYIYMHMYIHMYYNVYNNDTGMSMHTYTIIHVYMYIFPRVRPKGVAFAREAGCRRQVQSPSSSHAFSGK